MRSSLKILFTVHGYKPAYQVGGPIISVSSLAEALVRRGHSVTVFTTNCNMSEDLDVEVDCPHMVDGVQVWYFRRQEPLKKLFPFLPYLTKSLGLLYAPAMGRELKRIVPNVDLVHTHLPFIYPTYAGAHAASRYHKPLFYHQRGVFSPGRMDFRSFKKKLFMAAIEKPILRSATTLIALTDAEVETYQQFCPEIPCRVIPNGIDADQYRTVPVNSSVLNIPSDARVILFLGRLHPHKGADRLVEAFVRASSLVPDAVLVMAGPDEFSLGERLRDMVAESGLQHRVFFPGMVSGELKKDLLARADLFCLPSVGEGFSMAILESLASGTPVMISPGCYFPEVEAAGAGRVVAIESEIMAQTLVELMGNSHVLTEMGQKGRSFVAENYTWDMIAAKHEDAYREGIGRYS